MTTDKEIQSANEFDRNKFSVREGYTKLYEDKEVKKWFKEIVQELRKRNPYKFNEDDHEGSAHTGYRRACNELEKMEKE